MLGSSNPTSFFLLHDIRAVFNLVLVLLDLEETCHRGCSGFYGEDAKTEEEYAHGGPSIQSPFWLLNITLRDEDGASP